MPTTPRTSASGAGLKQTDSLGNQTGYTVNMYSATGQKLGAYLLTPSTYANGGNYIPIIQVALSTSDTYFGSRRLAPMDQLGSVGTYYPWGEDKGTTNPQNTWSFATYWRDSATNLDYANNRYYSSQYGRLTTPDPGLNTNATVIPQNWNRYAYVGGDPVNKTDPEGLCSPQDDPPCYSVTGTGDGSTGDGSWGSENGGAGDTSQAKPQTNTPFEKGGGIEGFAALIRITVTGYSRTGTKENTITNDLNDILNQVLTGGCASWLTNQDFSAGQLIAAMETSVSGGPSYGYGVLNSNTTAAFVGVTNTDGTPVAGLPPDASITVNSNGAFFNSGYTVGSGNTQYTGGTLQAQIFILIHELAHQIGAAGFQPDAGNPSAVAHNNALVQKNCGSQIAGIK